MRLVRHSLAPPLHMSLSLCRCARVRQTALVGFRQMPPVLTVSFAAFQGFIMTGEIAAAAVVSQSTRGVRHSNFTTTLEQSDAGLEQQRRSNKYNYASRAHPHHSTQVSVMDTQLFISLSRPQESVFFSPSPSASTAASENSYRSCTRTAKQHAQSHSKLFRHCRDQETRNGKGNTSLASLPHTAGRKKKEPYQETLVH